MKLTHCRKLLQDEDPFRNIPSQSVTFSPDPLLNTTSPAIKKPPFKPNSTPFDSSMALTVLILLTALFFMAFFSVYIRRLSSSDSAEQPRLRRRVLSPPPPRSCCSKGLDASTVGSLPLVPYGAAAEHQIDCAICLTEFEEKETVKMIPHCRHVFHPTCIDMWLASHVTCPLCRSTRICVAAAGKVCLGVAREDDNRGESERSTVDESERPTVDESERPTVDGSDTWREVGSLGVRRTCSCSSLGSRASLQRSMSF